MQYKVKSAKGTMWNYYSAFVTSFVNIQTFAGNQIILNGNTHLDNHTTCICWLFLVSLTLDENLCSHITLLSLVSNVLNVWKAFADRPSEYPNQL